MLRASIGQQRQSQWREAAGAYNSESSRRPYKEVSFIFLLLCHVFSGCNLTVSGLSFSLGSARLGSIRLDSSDLLFPSRTSHRIALHRLDVCEFPCSRLEYLLHTLWEQTNQQQRHYFPLNFRQSVTSFLSSSFARRGGVERGEVQS